MPTTRVYFDNSNGGDFATANNWWGRHVPTSTQTAVIGNVHHAVTSGANQTVAGLSITHSGSVLDVTGDTFAVNTVYNTGTVEATGGSLNIGSGSAAFTVTNKGGLIEADGGAVTFDDETVIQTKGTTHHHHGTVTTTGAGTLAAVGSNVTLVDTHIEGGILNSSAGGSFVATDALSVLDGSSSAGSLTNNGVVVAEGGAVTLKGAIVNAGTLVADASSGFLASGNVTLSGGGQVSLGAGGYIGGYSPATLNNVNNTISGAGFIYGSVALTNGAAGVIDATGKMVLNNENGSGVTNNGLIESTGAGALAIKDSTIGGTGSIVDGGGMTFNGVTLTGGSLTVDAGATLTTTTAPSTIGSGVAVTNDGTIKIASGAALTLQGGDIDNVGVIQANGSTALTGVYIDGAVSLTGGGEVLLNAKAYIGGYSPSSLYNVDNTITGAGFLYGSESLTNGASGVINATGRMVLNNEHGTVANDGLVESTGSGQLFVKNTTLDDTGGGQVVDGHRLYLNGATIDGGSVTVDAGAVLTSTGTGGTITGATVSNAGILEGSTGGLTVDGAVDNTGTIEANNGALTITGAVTDTGSARIVGSGVLTLDGSMAETVRFAAGSTGELVVGTSADFTGSISGFSKTSANRVDLQDVSFADYSSYSYSGTTASGVLTLYDSSDDVLATLDFQGNYTRSNFTFNDDGSGGTVISDPTKTTASFTQAIAAFAPSTGGAGGHTLPAGLTTTHLLVTPGHAA